MDTRILGYSFSGVLLSNKKEWATDTYDNMDESQKHDAK